MKVTLSERIPLLGAGRRRKPRLDWVRILVWTAVVATGASFWYAVGHIAIEWLQ